MKKKKKNTKKKSKWNFKFSRKQILIPLILFTSILLIASTYAWFYAALNVKILSLNLTVSEESGLYISLDGINYSGSVTVDEDYLFNELENNYPNHTSAWASKGLFPFSSNGISSPNNDKFDFFSSNIRYKDVTSSYDRVIDTFKESETRPNSSAGFIAFDVFLKNVTGSPYDDNLYLTEGTGIEIVDDKSEGADGNVNSLRMGFVKMSTVSKRSSVDTVQNISCDNRCVSVIYEPYSLAHSKSSITRAMKYNVVMEDGKYTPTYAVINEGRGLDVSSGQEGSKYELNSDYFALQNTITNFDNSIFPISNGITKVRVYVWLEGQDMDSLESRPMGSKLNVTINFYKDLAGYYQ